MLTRPMHGVKSRHRYLVHYPHEIESCAGELATGIVGYDSLPEKGNLRRQAIGLSPFAHDFLQQVLWSFGALNGRDISVPSMRQLAVTWFREKMAWL